MLFFHWVFSIFHLFSVMRHERPQTLGQGALRAREYGSGFAVLARDNVCNVSGLTAIDALAVRCSKVPTLKGMRQLPYVRILGDYRRNQFNDSQFDLAVSGST